MFVYYLIGSFSSDTKKLRKLAMLRSALLYWIRKPPAWTVVFVGNILTKILSRIYVAPSSTWLGTL
jgi:hypothetical protein